MENSIQTILFYFFSLVVIISSVGIVFLPKIIYSCIAMFISFSFVAGLFVLLDSDFLGLCQILIYSVALCILFAISIMLSGQQSEKFRISSVLPKVILAVMGIIPLFLSVLFSLTNGFSLFNKFYIPFSNQIHLLQLGIKLPENFSIKMIGLNLLTKYIFPFELISLIIVLALIGILVFCKKEDIEND